MAGGTGGEDNHTRPLELEVPLLWLLPVGAPGANTGMGILQSAVCPIVWIISICLSREHIGTYVVPDVY